MRISDWSSDVCSSDLRRTRHTLLGGGRGRWRTRRRAAQGGGLAGRRAGWAVAAGGPARSGPREGKPPAARPARRLSRRRRGHHRGRTTRTGVTMHVIATAGHVDHGKSTLVKALTGSEPDRLAEERRRGLSIELGSVWTSLPGVGEEAFVRSEEHTSELQSLMRIS